MSKIKKICVLYTETNGLHTVTEKLSKKNLYGFARLVVLNYEIFYYNKSIVNDEWVSIKKVRSIIKPRCMHISDESIKIHEITNEYAMENGIEIESVLNDFKNDLKDVSVIVSHNVAFHLNTILGEYVRYNIQMDFIFSGVRTLKNKYIIIDIMSFYHKLSSPKLLILYQNLYPNEELGLSNTIIKKKKSKNISKLEISDIPVLENSENNKNISKLELVKKCFIKLYKNYESSIVNIN